MRPSLGRLSVRRRNRYPAYDTRAFRGQAGLMSTKPPDLSFGAAADLIAEGDYVAGRWVGGGTHTELADFNFLAGSLPAATGRITGTTLLRLENGKIVEEIERLSIHAAIPAALSTT